MSPAPAPCAQGRASDGEGNSHRDLGVSSRKVLLEIIEDVAWEDLGIRHKIPRTWSLVVSCGLEKAMVRRQLLPLVCT